MFSDYDITEAMIRFGGGFVAGLGALWRRADEGNKARLKAAFPEYWKQYSHWRMQERITKTSG